MESSAGMISEIAPVILLPNPPPVYSLMKTTLSGSMFSQRAIAGTVWIGALRTGVNIHLAVLPVRHRAAGFQALMAGVGRDERFIQDEGGILEACVDIAEGPGVGRILMDGAHRHLAVLGCIEIRLGPFQLL